MTDFELERGLWEAGKLVVCGVDEAGRGPLAGPVTAAAAILPEDFTDAVLTDSKKLSEKQRDRLYDRITTDADIVWSVAEASVEEIDEINILKATHLAMQRAVEGLGKEVDHCLIDGLPVLGFAFPSTGVVKGDAKSLSIAAASIIAKVTRDRLMVEIDREFPEYGFARHKGYGTKAHREALREHGPCKWHRRSFAPVAQMELFGG